MGQSEIFFLELEEAGYTVTQLRDQKGSGQSSSGAQGKFTSTSKQRTESSNRSNVFQTTKEEHRKRQAGRGTETSAEKRARVSKVPRKPWCPDCAVSLKLFTQKQVVSSHRFLFWKKKKQTSKLF